jgi:hypothetical protein
MRVASRVESSHTIWCLAYLYYEGHAFPESRVSAVTHILPIACFHAQEIDKSPIIDSCNDRASMKAAFDDNPGIQCTIRKSEPLGQDETVHAFGRSSCARQT